MLELKKAFGTGNLLESSSGPAMDSCSGRKLLYRCLVRATTLAASETVIVYSAWVPMKPSFTAHHQAVEAIEALRISWRHGQPASTSGALFPSVATRVCHLLTERGV